MEDIKNFEDFYAAKIAPQIATFKKQDKAAGVWGVIMVLALIFTLVSFILTMYLNAEWHGAWVTALLLIFSVYSIYTYTQNEDTYTNNFKEGIIKEIIKYLHPELTYKPDSMVSEKEYRQSGLYRSEYNDIDGDDFIGGVYKNISFRCSELRVTGNGDSEGESSRLTAIFKGLFFAAAVNQAYTGGTYVWIRGEEQLGASIADERYRLIAFPKVYAMQMGDDMFDKYFSVYSTNPAEARTILDDAMMANLLQFRKQIQRKVVFSVVMGHCYVAIPIKEDLFEPTEPVGDKEEVKKYFFTVLLILSIINQLQLHKLQ
jgi:Protein of unknown function (DUF3137)